MIKSLHIKLLHCSFIYCQSLTVATTRWWSVWQLAPIKDFTLTTLECQLLSMKMWSVCAFSHRRSPSAFENTILLTDFLTLQIYYCITPCKLILDSWFEDTFSPNKISMLYFRSWLIIALVSHKSHPFVSPFLSSVGAFTFRTISHQHTLRIIYILSLTYSSLLTAVLIPFQRIHPNLRLCVIFCNFFMVKSY